MGNIVANVKTERVQDKGGVQTASFRSSGFLLDRVAGCKLSYRKWPREFQDTASPAPVSLPPEIANCRKKKERAYRESTELLN